MFVQRIFLPLYLSRIVGCVPYKITSLGLQNSNWSRVYSGVLILLYPAIVLIMFNNTHVTPATKNLVIIRHILIGVLLVSDVLMPIIKYGDFLKIFLEMDRFDNKINYRLSNLITIRSALYLFLLIAYPFFVLICTYMRPYVTSNLDIRRPDVFCCLIINTVIDMSILLFMILMESMMSRFRYLHHLVQSGGSTTLFGSRETFSNDLRPRDIWILYERLVATTEKINDHYSLQILLWISTACCSIIFRIYVISISTVYYDTLDIIGHIIGILSPALLAISIISVCHFVALEAKMIPVSLFSPKIWMRYRVGGTMGDNSDVCMYFGLRILKITSGFGIVPVNLPTIILFISFTSTYLQYLLK